MPSLDPDVYVTSYGFDGTYYGGAAQTMGYGLSGTWAVMAQLSDISFLEDLKHTVRVVYYQWYQQYANGSGKVRHQPTGHYVQYALSDYRG